MTLEQKLHPLIAKIYRIALSVLYPIFIVPNGWWARNMLDPLNTKKPRATGSKPQLWLERSTSDTQLDDARRQY